MILLLGVLVSYLCLYFTPKLVVYFDSDFILELLSQFFFNKGTKMLKKESGSK